MGFVCLLYIERAGCSLLHFKSLLFVSEFNTLLRSGYSVQASKNTKLSVSSRVKEKVLKGSA